LNFFTQQSGEKVFNSEVGFTQIARQCKRAQAKKCFLSLKNEPVN